MKSNSILGKVITNSMPTNGIYNSSGQVDPSSTGFKYAIDTLTYIRSRVTSQKFYEIPIANYMPVDVGEGGCAEEIVQNQTFMQGGDFYDGDIDTLSGNGRVSTVDAALSPIRMPIKTWAKQVPWTLPEIQKAAVTNNWDPVRSKLASLKKNWDLGIQQTAFLGHPNMPDLTGLLNNGNVNINTTLISEPIKDKDDSDFQSFIGALLQEYFDNSESTVLPDTFTIPTSDYLGLGSAASSQFPNISKLQYMLDAFRMMTGNPNFTVLPLVYAQEARSFGKLSNDRYTLYRRDPDSMKMSIPVDFTMLQADTSNQLMWTQPAYGQYSGLMVMRPREVLYMDINEGNGED